MKKILKKLEENKIKDPAHFSEDKIKKKQDEETKIMLEEFKKKELEKKETIKKIEKELAKYKRNDVNIYDLCLAINKRFNVKKTNSKASFYGVACVYFNALKVFELPESYYPLDDDDPDLFIPPQLEEDPRYWLWMFQRQTSSNNRGHTIPNMPGKINKYVIHGLLFPMTSSTIYLGKFDFKPYGIIYSPNDELMNRKDNYNELYFETYEDAYNKFLEMVENHIDTDEEIYYAKTKDKKYK
jgi:hypothetical protein